MTKPHAASDDLRTIKRLIFVALVVVVIIGGVFYKSSIDAVARSEHDRCISGNGSRQAIKDAFADLYDGFITASGRSQAALDFKATRMAELEKRLPQRQC